MQVKLADDVELEVNTTFDDLYRTNVVSAEYFDQAEHTIADYDYFGYRLLKKTMGNGAALNVGYDGKRRINDFTWKDTSANVLVGYQYDYDDVDNPLHEKFLHDNGFYDNYQYDALYRLTGVVYREGAAMDYRSTSSGWTAGEYGQFNYDDNSNRTTSTDGDPFGNVAATEDSYNINEANESTQITRDSSATNPRRAERRESSGLPQRRRHS